MRKVTYKVDAWLVIEHLPEYRLGLHDKHAALSNRRECRILRGRPCGDRESVQMTDLTHRERSVMCMALGPGEESEVVR